VAKQAFTSPLQKRKMDHRWNILKRLEKYYTYQAVFITPETYFEKCNTETI
jgi:hypothetical protein